ncbi:MAG: DNA repair protein RecN [Firmicutes bacterium]|nr:DNA repair protein RecN [Bacillota bacterium]
MLESLHIENIAVVERADVCFTPGLNVLTGETGAGKSIVIDALDAVLGGRVSRELVRSGEARALVSAVFLLEPAEGGAETAAAFCAENGMEQEGQLILQRSVSADGKTAARVCGVPVTAAQLRELGALLLDIHGQNDGRRLLDEATHLKYLDGYGGHTAGLQAFRAAYEAYRATGAEISRLSLDEFEKERLRESLTDQIAELEKANLRAGEWEELEARRELLKNAGRLTEAIGAAYDALYGADTNAISLSDEAAALLARAAKYAQELSNAEVSIQNARYLLEDAAELLRDFRATLDFSPQEYDALETRLSELRRLTKRYGGDEAELLLRLERNKTRLDELEYADDRLAQLERVLAAQKKAALAAAEQLTSARKNAAERLKKELVAQLKDLSMPAVRFEAEITPVRGAPGFDASGGDEVRFLMSANAGEAPERISKIASGGELSRIMLAMKHVFAERDSVPTLVFDEIDAGVSGIAAQRVGEKLADLSRVKQVLCVTHLPQIAAMADTHFLVEKTIRAGRTYTLVTELDRQGRVEELARLHGGDNVTEITRQSAAEQLDAAGKWKRGQS